MGSPDSERPSLPLGQPEVSDEDLYEAMKDIQGYLDITPADLKKVMAYALRHALHRLGHIVRAKDVMSAPVYTVKRQTPLRDVAELMSGKRISGVPVLEEDGRVAGMLSVRNFLSHMGMTEQMHLMDVIAECLRGERCLTSSIVDKRAEDIMTAPPVCVGENASLSEIAELLAGRKFGRVPVVSDRGVLIGIVSKTDLLRMHLIQAR